MFAVLAVFVVRREAVTPRHAPVLDRFVGAPAGRSRNHSPLARPLTTFMMVICFALGAAASPHARKQTEKPESVSARFTIHPNDVTLAVSQTQFFGVTDANGKIVPVRWKISGVGCSTAACGTIDGDGAYRAPQSVSRPLVVMLEGIPLTDAEFPAFARIQLTPGIATPSPAPPAPAPSISAPSAPVVANEPEVAAPANTQVSNSSTIEETPPASTPIGSAAVASAPNMGFAA